MLSNWHLMRVLRLLMGIAILVQADMMKDIPFFLIGVLFTAMPLFDIGCCASGTCVQAAPARKMKTRRSSMKKWFKNNLLYIIGALVGAAAGYIYWQQVGCASGTCMITSKPLNSTLTEP